MKIVITDNSLTLFDMEGIDKLNDKLCSVFFSLLIIGVVVLFVKIIIILIKLNTILLKIKINVIKDSNNLYNT